MTLFLAGKRIVLGVTGSIAAYKSADLVRRLREAGAVVRVVMTENAKKFITPLTMQAVSGYPIHDDLFDAQAEAAMGHIELAKWADVILVAPASADFLARLLQGRANDLLATVCLATKALIAVAPAMNQGMWNHTMTQANQQALREKNIHFFGPTTGSQACGDVGFGRMLEPADILIALNQIFASDLLAGLKVLITAGPTQEAFDPIRYISNVSSGKMGFALASAAQEAGANVTVVSGPVNLTLPAQMEVIHVKTALAMHEAVMNEVSKYDMFFAVAAVSDYRPQAIAAHKIHKTGEELFLTLIRNPDIALDVGKLHHKPFIVGFAAETENLTTQARAKLMRKNMDMIVANLVHDQIGMGVDNNQVTVLTQTSQVDLPLMSKAQLARELIVIIANEFSKYKRRENVTA